MKRILLLCLLMTCAACSETSQQTPAGAGPGSPESSREATHPTDASAPMEDSAVYSRMPDQMLKFDFELELKSDKRSVTPSGKERRGLALQYSGLSSADLWSRVDGAFQRAGYAAHGARLVDAAGTSKQTYSKAGQPMITVSVPSPEDGAAGAGYMWLGWDI